MDILAETEWMKDAARAVGFDLVGVAAAGPAPGAAQLREWLGAGMHGDMAWLVRRQEDYADPRRLMPDVRSVIALGVNYYHPRPPQPEGTVKVSSYAWGRDYHKVIGKMLKRLRTTLEQRWPQARFYQSVDSGPVLERSWAQAAGLGWCGKNTLLIHPPAHVEHAVRHPHALTGPPQRVDSGGSYYFLATLLTDCELAADTPFTDLCGKCTACLDICPTGALVTPGVLDARRCITYWTVEQGSPGIENWGEKMAGWGFGCDLCQSACPWNKFSRDCAQSDFQPRLGQAYLHPDEFLTMTQDAFHQRFAGTPLMRAGLAGMQRNLRVRSGE